MGSPNFLWKPVSEGNGGLVILLPTQFRDVRNLTLTTEDGREIQGRFAGNEHNGARPHFRFDQPGRAFGQNVTVSFPGGEFKIQNGALRTDSPNLDALSQGSVPGSNRGPGTSGGGHITGAGGNTGVVPEFFDFLSIPPAFVDFDEAFDFAQNLGEENRETFLNNLQDPEIRESALGLVDTDVQGITQAANVLAPFNRGQGRLDTAENITRAQGIDEFNLSRIPGFNQFNRQETAATNEFLRQEREKTLEASGVDFRGRITQVLDQLQTQTTGTLSDEFLDRQTTRVNQNRGADIASARGVSGRSTVGRNIQDRLDLDTRLNIALDAQKTLPNVLTQAQQVLQPPEQQAPTIFAEPTQVPLNVSSVAERLPVQSNISAGAAQQQIASQATDIQTIPAETGLSANLNTQQFNESSRVNTAFRAGELTQQQFNVAAGVEQGVINADKADAIRNQQFASFQAGLDQREESEQAGAFAQGIGAIVGGVASAFGLGNPSGSTGGQVIPGSGSPGSVANPSGGGTQLSTPGSTLNGISGPIQVESGGFGQDVIDFITDDVPEAAGDLITSVVDGVSDFFSTGNASTAPTEVAGQPVVGSAFTDDGQPAFQLADSSIVPQSETDPTAFARMSRTIQDPGIDAQTVAQTTNTISNWDSLDVSQQIIASSSIGLNVAQQQGIIDVEENRNVQSAANAIATIVDPNSSDRDKGLAIAGAVTTLGTTGFSGNVEAPSEIGGQAVVGSAETTDGQPGFLLADGSVVSSSALTTTANTVNSLQALAVLSSDADTETKLAALAGVGIKGAQANQIIDQSQAGNAGAALSIFNTATKWSDMNDIQKAASVIQTGNAVFSAASNLTSGGSIAGVSSFGSGGAAAANSSAVSGAGSALGAAAGVAGVVLGVHQAATTIDAMNDMPQSQAVGAGATGLGGAGAAIGAGIGATLVASGAAAGSVVPVVGTAIGAAVGVLAGVAIGSTGSGKGTGQMMRDSWRGGLEKGGFAEKIKGSHHVTLADGSKYDIGRDGGHKLQNKGANIDGKNERHTFDVDWSNPAAVESIPDAHIFAIATGLDPSSNDFDIFHRSVAQSLNAASSNADSKEGIQQNFKAMMEQAGVDPRHVGMRVEILRQMNRISEEEYGVYLNSLNQIFGSKITSIDKETGRNALIQSLSSKPELADSDRKLLEFLTDPKKLNKNQMQLNDRLKGK